MTTDGRSCVNGKISVQARNVGNGTVVHTRICGNGRILAETRNGGNGKIVHTRNCSNGGIRRYEALHLNCFLAYCKIVTEIVLVKCILAY